MSKSRLSKPFLLKLSLSAAAIVITVICIELAGRFLYTNETNNFQSTTASLIENISEENRLGGNKLRMKAWNASFTERGLEVPEKGPRDGRNGDRITPKRCSISDCKHLSAIPGIIEIDEYGFQYAGRKEEASPNILIIGGSVAWGAAASDIENTYFDKLYHKLNTKYPDIGISVLASASSTSGTDLYSFVNKGIGKNPDIVIFLNGLNDITVQEAVVKNAGDYILNMKTAIKIADLSGIKTVIIRQPYPGSKKIKTDFEKRIMEISEDEYEKTIIPHYKYIGAGLQKIADGENVYYIDAAGCFENESETTFSDQWHFSDPGQELLAECIYSGLLPIIKKIPLR